LLHLRRRNPGGDRDQRSYWNWYGFPTVYTAAYMFMQIVGFLCVGLVVAFVLRKTTLPTAV
jgi:hypothetical protein